MHFPCTCICIPKLHNSICAYPHWVLVYASARSGQELLCLFADPDFSRAMVLSSGIPWSTVATPGFALVQVKMQLPTIACAGQLIPHALGWHRGFFSRQSLYPWFSRWGKSLELRGAVFQHAVSDIAGMKMGFIVTFFIKGINSPTNNLNAFS